MAGAVKLCPSCNFLLKSFRHEGVEIETCPKCRGMWFDSGDLGSLHRHGAGLRTDDHSWKPVMTHDTLRCPERHGALVAVETSAMPQLCLTVCQTCKGVWLDHDMLCTARVNQGQVRSNASLRLLREKTDSIHYEQREEEVVSVQDTAEPGVGAFWDWMLDIDPEIHSPVARTPYVTYALILANLLAFLAMTMAVPVLNAPESFFQTWGLVPAQILAGQGLITLFTSMFLHANLAHLIGNMYFLWLTGDNVEDRLGHWRYLGLYVVCGLAADLLHIGSTLVAGGGMIPCIGASGAISGIIGAYVALFPRRKFACRIYYLGWCNWLIRVPAYIYFVWWFILQVVFALIGVGGVAFWAHIGGFLFGLALGCYLRWRPWILSRA